MPYKQYFIGIAFLVSTLFLGGCDMEETIENTEEKVSNKLASISIPFEWFKKEPEDVKEIIIPNVEGLNLTDEKVVLEDLVVFQESVAEISEELKDEDNFKEITNGNKSVFNVIGSGHFSMRYGEKGDALTDAIKKIGETPHQFVNSLTLVKYGVRINTEGQRIPYAVVDINAVNDSDDFHIHSVVLTLDDKGSIVSSTGLGEPLDKPHTVTPLTKDSLLYDDTHQEFQRDFQKIIQSLSNPNLYEQIQLEEITSTDETITALTKQIGIESKNSSTIFSLVKHGKGTFEEWGITGYLYSDKDVNAITFYELIVADENGYNFYTVHYNRGLKEITNISKGSPFEKEHNS